MENTPTTPPQPVAQPFRQPRGAKLDQSPYRDQVATMLLMRKGYRACLKYLDEQNFHINFDLLKDFEINYVSKMSQDTRDKLIEEGQKKESERDSNIVTQAVHTRLSRVESLINQVEYAEEQLARLDAALVPDDSRVIYQRGQWTDRLCFLRGKLETARLESEVERERNKAIEAVSLIAAEYIKDTDELEQFAKRVAELQDRRQ